MTIRIKIKDGNNKRYKIKQNYFYDSKPNEDQIGQHKNKINSTKREICLPAQNIVQIM